MGETGAGSFNSELVSASLALEEDGNDLLELDFLQRFDSEDIRELRQFFFDGDPDDERTRVHETRRPNDLSLQYAGYGGKPLDKNQFITAVNSIVGSTACSLSASKLFHVLDSSNQGIVWWEEVLDHMIQRIAFEVGDSTWMPLDTCVLLPDTPHCKRETIVKVVPIETKTSFCYAVLTKFGRVGVYDGHFTLHDTYLLQLRYGDPAFSFDGENRRRVNRTWVTDAVYLPDAEALLIVSSDRALHLYDCSGLIHAPLCHVAGLKNVPLCLAYSAGSAAGQASILFMGDDKGNITTLTFLQPRVSLFRKKHPDKLDKYYWVEIETQTDWVRLRVDPLVHGDSVRQLAYFPDNQTLVSCSQDPTTTLVIRHMSAKRTPYIFRLARGICCFHLDRTMRLLATGSNDCVVRLWNPVVTKEPTVSLFGHKTAVVDVLILRHIASVLSCSRDGVLKVWDIDDLCCIQTLPLNFPSFSVLGKRIEFGTRSLYPGPSSGKPPVSTASRVESATPDLPPPSTRTSTSHVTSEDVRDNPSEPSVNVWTRRTLLVACCNHLAVLHLRPRGEGVGSAPSTPSPLPPPSREHHAAVPSPWELTETTISSRSTPMPSPRHVIMPESSYQVGDEFGSPSSSHDESNIGTTLRSPSQKHSPRRGSDLDLSLGSPTSETSLSPRTRRASKMSEALPDREFKQKQPVRPSKDLNARRVYHKRQMREAHTFVEQCAPHLALQLWEIDEVCFSRPLPVTTRMREAGVDVSDPERLMKARLKSTTSLSLTASGSLTSESPSGRSSRSVSRKLFSPSSRR